MELRGSLPPLKSCADVARRSTPFFERQYMADNREASAIDASQNSATAGSEKMKMQRLLHWLKEEGATFPAVEIEVSEAGRVARTALPIKAGGLVMHIPRSLMITSDDARTSEIGRLIASNAPRISNSGHMAAYLLDAGRGGGPWGRFLDTLPQRFPEHPYLFEESELEYLNGCYELRKLRDVRRLLHSEYDKTISALPGHRTFTREEYRWARCVIASRAFITEISGQRVSSLVPLADMLDHSASNNVRWRSEATHGFLYIAARDIEAGETLTISYGAVGNSRLFVVYGFCLENNERNLAEIELPDLPPAHPCCELAKGFGTARDGMRVFQVPAEYDHVDSAILFSYLRLSALNDPSGINLPRDGKGIAVVGAISMENEEAALTRLAQVCRQRLLRFSTSMEEDEALLKDKTLPLRLRNAMCLRHGEKRVLRYFQDLAEIANPVGKATTWPQKFAVYFERTLPLLSSSK
jgi:histone-lysine N-methyltransferase SETD3